MPRGDGGGLRALIFGGGYQWLLEDGFRGCEEWVFVAVRSGYSWLFLGMIRRGCCLGWMLLTIRRGCF